MKPIQRVKPTPGQPDTQFAVVPGPDPDPSTQSWRQRLWWTFHQRHGLGRGLHFFSGSHVNDVFDLRLGWKDRAVRLFWSVWKGAPPRPLPSQPSSALVLSPSRSPPPRGLRQARSSRRCISLSCGRSRSPSSRPSGAARIWRTPGCPKRSSSCLVSPFDSFRFVLLLLALSDNETGTRREICSLLPSRRPRERASQTSLDDALHPPATAAQVSSSGSSRLPSAP